MNFDDELPEKSTPAPQEREISLGTGTILGIFIALVLLCGAFFGFGYSMGRRAERAAAASFPDTSTIAASNKNDPTFSNFKAAPVAENHGSPAPAPTAIPPSEAPAPAPSAEAPATEAAKSTSADAPAPEAVVEPPVSSDGTWMVQVSATTRKPDAEALTRVLIQKGFTATIHKDQDEKFHVRVGPFAAKKDADTTRKLLVVSGYKDPFITPK